MIDVVLGVVALVVGFLLCIFGLRVFLTTLPLWGFVSGILAGGAVYAATTDTGFLTTIPGIVVALVFGVVLGVLSQLFWSAGALIMAGAGGGIFGAAVIATLGNSDSWLLAVVGALVAALAIVGAVLLGKPMMTIILATAALGAALALTGFNLVVDNVHALDVVSTAFWERLDGMWFLWVVWALLAVTGFGAQWQSRGRIKVPVDRLARKPAEPGARERRNDRIHGRSK